WFLTCGTRRRVGSLVGRENLQNLAIFSHEISLPCSICRPQVKGSAGVVFLHANFGEHPARPSKQLLLQITKAAQNQGAIRRWYGKRHCENRGVVTLGTGAVL